MALFLDKKSLHTIEHHNEYNKKVMTNYMQQFFKTDYLSYRMT